MLFQVLEKLGRAARSMRDKPGIGKMMEGGKVKYSDENGRNWEMESGWG